jgi:hypothetical protein
MSKKHFIAIAAALRNNAPDQHSQTEAEKDLFERIVGSVATVCTTANPNFDRARFEAACGVLTLGS